MVFSPIVALRATPSALVTTGWQLLSEYRHARRLGTQQGASI
jgi:hypothetical protein